MPNEPRRHAWKLREDGSVDAFGDEWGSHNGPACTACSESFCEPCEPERWLAISVGADPAECANWHACEKPTITGIRQTRECSEPGCGRTYVVTAQWSEGRKAGVSLRSALG